MTELEELLAQIKILNEHLEDFKKMIAPFIGVQGEGGEMREIVLAEIASLFCKKHYGIDIKTTPDINVYNDSLDFADQILSLPSGYIAGEHELTVQEALEDYRRIIFEYPSYPHIGFYNGERITKPIIPQTR